MQCTRYTCQILMKIELLGRFSKNVPMPNLVKICTVEAKL
jgi:hypothetical protein